MSGVSRFLDPNRSASITQRCRQRRNEEFKHRFPDLADMRVLDLGGTAVSWRVAGLRALHVTVVNLLPEKDPEQPWIKLVQGDACEGGFGQFDLVFSNSVLEHVGGHARRVQFAEVIRESAPTWWVQTPYRYFPIEPHWLFPGFQFLPFRARLAVARHWNTGHRPADKDRLAAADSVASVELLTATEMRAYFPGSDIWYERIAGLRKSVVSCKESVSFIGPSRHPEHSAAPS